MSKIFVSYKYDDCRNYVDALATMLKEDWGHIYKGEHDGEDLSGYSDEYIQNKLKDRMFDSTVTIVLISKNMKEPRNEKDQWIPWEISYSLRQATRGDFTSYPNGMLAVVIPDENGSYDYAVKHYNCVTTWQTNNFFRILEKNMFNRNNKNHISCKECYGTHHIGNNHSYIHPVKWNDFLQNPNHYIDLVTGFRKNIDDYDLMVQL